MNTAIGRTETALLTNKSGGSVAQGDVVIVDIANASAFTTTTTGAYVSGRIGVVLEPNGIANNGTGLIAFTGYVPLINLSGTGSIGDIIKTHTVAKQGVRHAAPQVAGDFAQALGTTATPAALLFGTVQLGGGTASSVTPTVKATHTAGDLTLNSTSSTLADLNTGLDLTIAAVTGDVIGINMSGIYDAGASGNWTVIDAVTRVAAADVNWVSTGTGSNANLGVAAWFRWEAADTLSGEWLYTVQAGDLSGGNVTFRFRYKTGVAGNRTLRAASGQALTVWAKNYGH